MIEVAVEIDSSKVDRLLADFPDRLAKAQKKALMDIGAAVSSRATRVFRDPTLRPSPWAPRKSVGDGHPLLMKSKILWRSIRYRLVGDDTVEIGTDRKYAAYHQLGTEKMPARPFLPLDARGRLLPAMERKIEAIVRDAVADAFKS